MTFEDQLDVILRHEGQFQKWREDRGNWLNGQLVGTKYGVTAGRLAMHRGVRHVTEADMRALGLDEAKAIFRRHYYDRARIGLLPDQIEAKTFDCCVNHGVAGGVKLLQKTIRSFGHEISIDGKIGPETTRLAYAVVRDVGPRAFVNAMVQVRNDYYAAIIRNNPSQARFRRGWLSRSNSFTNTADVAFVPDQNRPDLTEPPIIADAQDEREEIANNEENDAATPGTLAQIGRAFFGWFEVFVRRSGQA